MNDEDSKPNIGYCVVCGKEMPYNIEYPMCYLCGGPCSALNRFSSESPYILYCHECGLLEYPEEGIYLCSNCLKKH